MRFGQLLLAALSSALLVACSPEQALRQQPIVGGAPDSAHPEVGLLLFNASRGTAVGGCSAVLVGPSTLLTAAHCVKDKVIETTLFKSSSGKIFSIAALHPNPAWDKAQSAYLNDIGIATLATPADIAPLELSRSAPTAGMTVALCGYGRSVVDDPKSSGVKRLGSKTIASVAATYFTVSGLQGNSAEGDSGGAALVSVGGEEQQIGVISSSAVDYTTSYHMRIDAFLGWVKSVAGSDLGKLPVASEGSSQDRAGPTGDSGPASRSDLAGGDGAGPGARPTDGCAVGGGGARGSMLLVLLAWLGLRRRRRPPATILSRPPVE